MIRNIKKKTKPGEESKPFGFCRIEIVQTDELGKSVIRDRYQASLHKVVEKFGIVEFIALFPPFDPVRKIRLSYAKSEIITAVWWHGTSVNINDHVPEAKVLAVLESIYSETKRYERVFLADAFCELIPDCYENPMTAEFAVQQKEEQYRVVKILLRMPKEMFEEWSCCYNAFKEFDKEGKDTDENNKDKENTRV